MEEFYFNENEKNMLLTKMLYILTNVYMYVCMYVCMYIYFCHNF